MRPIRLIAVVFTLFLSAPSFAQEPAAPKPQSGGGEWIEYVDCAERFTVNFPGQPAIRDTTYQPQRGKPLPARVYTVQDGPRRYSMTVVNYAGGFRDVSDVLGSIAWEAWNFRKRGGEVTYDAYAQVDRIEGHQIQMSNLDKSVTFAAIHLHAARLYVLEATVPPGSPGAVHFQQSLMILDDKAVRIRYNLDADGNRTGRATYEPVRCQ